MGFDREALPAAAAKAAAVGVVTFALFFTSDLGLLQGNSGIKDALWSGVDGIVSAVLALAVQLVPSHRAGPDKP